MSSRDSMASRTQFLNSGSFQLLSSCVKIYVTVFVDVTGSSSLTNSRARPASMLAGG